VHIQPRVITSVDVEIIAVLGGVPPVDEAKLAGGVGTPLCGVLKHKHGAGNVGVGQDPRVDVQGVVCDINTSAKIQVIKARV
jgi:hypothetical protein